MSALFVSLPFLIGGVTTPFVGLIVDKIGLKSVFIMFWDLMFLLAHLLLAFFPQVN